MSHVGCSKDIDIYPAFQCQGSDDKAWQYQTDLKKKADFFFSTSNPQPILTHSYLPGCVALEKLLPEAHFVNLWRLQLCSLRSTPERIPKGLLLPFWPISKNQELTMSFQQMQAIKKSSAPSPAHLLQCMALGISSVSLMFHGRLSAFSGFRDLQRWISLLLRHLSSKETPKTTCDKKQTYFFPSKVRLAPAFDMAGICGLSESTHSNMTT